MTYVFDIFASLIQWDMLPYVVISFTVFALVNIIRGMVY